MDFDLLRDQIEAAVKCAFMELHQQHAADGIYAFALYSDGGAMTVCPSTNTLKHLDNADPDDLAYYKFEPAEWKFEMQGAQPAFNEICARLLQESRSLDDDDNEEAFEAFRDRLFATCVDVLEKLKNEEFFTQIFGRDVFLMFTVSDYDFEPEDVAAVVERLNDNAYKAEYLDWMKTWADA